MKYFIFLFSSFLHYKMRDYRLVEYFTTSPLNVNIVTRQG